jgi:hypothetical protein
LVSLIHTNRTGEFFLDAAMKLTSGKNHECPILYSLVEQFVGFPGRGVMKRLILDRGFIDGPCMGRCKTEWGLDVLIPARTNMDIYTDAVSLAQSGALSFQAWSPPPPAPQPVPIHRPESIRKREQARQNPLAQQKAPPPSVPAARTEIAAVFNLETFSTCPVPLQVVVNREIDARGQSDYWVLMDTAHVADPAQCRSDYALRTAIEERHRQLKCFSGLGDFSSRAFNLIVNQVAFVLLTYSLLQWYRLRDRRQQLNRKTCPRLLDLLRPTWTVILIYSQNYVAFLTPLEPQEMVLTLCEPARKKILAKTQKLRRSLAHQLQNPRAP